MAESLLELDGKLDYDRERSHTRTGVEDTFKSIEKIKINGPNYVRKPGRIYNLKNVAEWLDGTGLYTAGNYTAK